MRRYSGFIKENVTNKKNGMLSEDAKAVDRIDKRH